MSGNQNEESKISRLKRNQMCRQILMAAHIDLDYLTVQNTAHSIHLSGKLIKLQGEDLAVEELMELFEKLKRIAPNLITDLENWDLNGWQARKLPPKLDPRSYKVLDKKKKKKKLFGEKIIVDIS